ncbi:hypothetical protein CEXT_471001 [Caerostris extrusa]|uniref:Uncharacterized protein n=1 Tax=Caerostris extrusa TaxID=172846 RepID=A0AAV4VDK7_CAEEX|nr:hypothetical protein CEXT_471001 [Caerostris extrusa]
MHVRKSEELPPGTRTVNTIKIAITLLSTVQAGLFGVPRVYPAPPFLPVLPLVQCSIARGFIFLLFCVHYNCAWCYIALTFLYLKGDKGLNTISNWECIFTGSAQRRLQHSILIL